MYEIRYYKNTRGDSPVAEFIDKLGLKSKVKVFRYLENLEAYGPLLPRPYADYLRDKIYELRVTHGRLSIRILYFFVKGKIIVLTSGFLKKKDKVDKREIETAVNRMNDYLKRHRGG